MKRSKPLQTEDQAYRYALWLLNRRAHSRGEMIGKLKRRDLPFELQGKVLARLEAKRFIDDRQFTEIFIRSKRSQNWGPRKIELALLQKKVPRELVQRSLGTDFTRDQEKEQARELLSRQRARFMGQKEKKPGDRKRRAFDFLARKGYSLEAARLAVLEIFRYNPELP
ncbi:MAG TPA: regulatory protein RecX [bacterium]|nr:regulatory protein RecX [bacterium]